MAWSIFESKQPRILRAIQLSRACSATTVLDCGVIGPRSAFGERCRKADRRRRPRSHDREAPEPKLPWKTDQSVPAPPVRSWGLATRKNTPLRVEAAPAGGPIGTKSGAPIPTKSGVVQSREILHRSPEDVVISIGASSGMVSCWFPLPPLRALPADQRTKVSSYSALASS